MIRNLNCGIALFPLPKINGTYNKNVICFKFKMGERVLEEKYNTLHLNRIFKTFI